MRKTGLISSTCIVVSLLVGLWPRVVRADESTRETAAPSAVRMTSPPLFDPTLPASWTAPERSVPAESAGEHGSVPEPTTILFLICGGATAIFFGRKRYRRRRLQNANA